jgi:hypothetical protein
MTIIEKIKNRLRGRVVSTPVKEVDLDQEHDFTGLELPTDMGKKTLTMCSVKGCSEFEVRLATVAERVEALPLTRAVRILQGEVMDEIKKAR